jgi:peroxiredoxin Q/BCP
MVEEGKPAPDFELSTDNGARVKLSSLHGKPVVLYFYPKDERMWNTSSERGATSEIASSSGRKGARNASLARAVQRVA